MSDLINRQAAIDAIEAKEANEFGNYLEYNVAFNDGLRSAVFAIEDLPSAQTEIVRCKDCKHRDAETGFCEGRGWPMQVVPDYGFCDKGERRE